LGKIFTSLEQLELESSNFVHRRATSRISLGMTNYPQVSLMWVMRPMFEFWDPHLISEMGEAGHFKFGTQIDRGEY